MNNCKGAMALYTVTDRSWLKGDALAAHVEKAILGGATCIQMREKELEFSSFVAEAKKIKTVTDAYQIPFIINDHVEVALAVDADGVHLGQGDEAIYNARKKLGKNKIIGISAHTVDLALAAEEGGADYIGVGAVFPTMTKNDADFVPAPVLKEICASVRIPVVAIGGISAQNLRELAGSGLDGIAVVSAIFAAKDIESAAKELRSLVYECLGK